MAINKKLNVFSFRWSLSKAFYKPMTNLCIVLRAVQKS